MKFPEKLVVNVTQDNINNGVEEDCNKCPIALAVIDYLKAEHPFFYRNAFCNVSVTALSIVIIDKIGNMLRYETSFDILCFMDDFDLEGPEAVKPFKFESFAK